MAVFGEISRSVDTTGVRRLEREHPVHVAFAYKDDGSRMRHLPPETMATVPVEIRPYFVDNTHETDTYYAGSPTPDDIPRNGWRRPGGPPPAAAHQEPCRASGRPSRCPAGSTHHGRFPLARTGRWRDVRASRSPPAHRCHHAFEADLRELLPDMPIVDAALWLIDQGRVRWPSRSDRTDRSSWTTGGGNARTGLPGDAVDPPVQAIASAEASSSACSKRET